MPENPSSMFSSGAEVSAEAAGATAPIAVPPEEESEPMFVEPQSATDESETAEVSVLDFPLKLSEQDEKAMVSFLRDNLPKMRPSEDDVRRIRTYYEMYDLAAHKRNFPYENAPSLASSDPHQKLNDFLDQAETAFLQQKVTFAIDRENAGMPEEITRRVERTMHREFFLNSGFAKDLRLILFESAFLDGCIVNVRENFDIRPVREKIVIRNAKDITTYGDKLTISEMDQAKQSISEGKPFIAEKESLKMIYVGPKVQRIDQTKFLYPRNTKTVEEWQVVAEQEFYTRSALQDMAERGEISKKALQKCIDKRKELYGIAKDDSSEARERLSEEVKGETLDADWRSDMENIKEFGDSYDDEFAIYRATMLYSVPYKGGNRLRTWVQVLFCPAGDAILGSKFCPDGEFPYHTIQMRPVPYRTLGVGIARERYPYAVLDSDLKSYFLAAIEQEMGAPLLIRSGSNLFATSFRAYPGSVTYTQDPKNDAMFLAFPERSQLAVNGMKMVLGSSPSSNSGADYASGKREEILMQKEQTLIKARIYSIAMDLDPVFNSVWRIYCRLSRLNTIEKKFIPWVYDEKPDGKRLFVLADEMKPDILWSSAVTAASLTPDSRLQRALMEKQILYDKVPVAINNPRLSVAWLAWIADFFEDMDDAAKKALLPTMEDFAAYQQQLAMQGAEMGGAPGPQESTSAVAQSPATPNRNPGSKK